MVLFICYTLCALLVDNVIIAMMIGHFAPYKASKILVNVSRIEIDSIQGEV